MENRLIYFAVGNAPGGSSENSVDQAYVDRLKEVQAALGGNTDAVEEIGRQIEAATEGAGELEDDSITAIESAGNMAFQMDFDDQIGSDAQLDPLNAQFSAVLGPMKMEFAIVEGSGGKKVELVSKAPATERERLEGNFRGGIAKVQEAMENGDMVSALIALGELWETVLEFTKGFKEGTLNDAYESASTAERKSMKERRTKLINETSGAGVTILNLITTKGLEVNMYDNNVVGNPKSISVAEGNLTTAKTDVTAEQANLANLQATVTDPITPAQQAQIAGSKASIDSKKTIVNDKEKIVADLKKEKAELQKDITMLKEMEREDVAALTRFSDVLTANGKVLMAHSNADFKNIGAHLEGATITRNGAAFEISTVSEMDLKSRFDSVLQDGETTSVIDGYGKVLDPTAFIRFIEDNILKLAKEAAAEAEE